MNPSSSILSALPKRQREAIYASIGILLFAAVACAPMLWYGAPNGHSIVYNLSWLKNFSAQLAQGDIYPRWLMDMNHGAGSPAFYFYAPLPFYIASLPALLLGGKLTVQLAFGEWLLLALSGIAFYRFARRRFTLTPALFGALLYMLLPYHFEIDLWRRQDIGELANYVWMPLILYYVDKLFDGRRALSGLAICYCLMMLSHLPSALLFSICLGCYVLVLLWYRHAWRWLPNFVLAIGVGILLAAVYWVPALFTEQYVRADQLWTPYFDYHRWFFPINEAPHHDASSQVFAKRLFTMISVTTGIFALFWLNAFRWRETVGSKRLWGSLMLIGTAWFLMTSSSAFVWENVPELWKVQFPWRIAMVVDLATAIVGLYAVQCLRRHRDVVSISAMGAALALLGWCLTSADIKHKLDPFDNAWWVTGRDNAVRNGLDAPEYTTLWNHSQSPDTSMEIADREQVTWPGASGEIDVARWAPRRIELQVNLQRDATAVVRQFYFPNWHARIDGRSVPIKPTTDYGLIEIPLPPGQYLLELKLQSSPQELIGLALSLSGLSILLVGAWWRNRHRNSPLAAAA